MILHLMKFTVNKRYSLANYVNQLGFVRPCILLLLKRFLEWFGVIVRV